MNEYAHFEPSLNDIAAISSQRFVKERLLYLVPDLVPSEALFWKRLMYKLHLVRVESIATIRDNETQNPIDVDEESIHWD